MMTIGRDHNGMLSGPRPARAFTSRGACVWKRRQYITMVRPMDEDFSKISGPCQENSAVLSGSSRPDAIYSVLQREEPFR
jgi:hypothetical protein